MSLSYHISAPPEAETPSAAGPRWPVSREARLCRPRGPHRGLRRSGPNFLAEVSLPESEAWGVTAVGVGVAGGFGGASRSDRSEGRLPGGGANGRSHRKQNAGEQRPSRGPACGSERRDPEHPRHRPRDPIPGLAEGAQCLKPPNPPATPTPPQPPPPRFPPTVFLISLP